MSGLRVLITNTHLNRRDGTGAYVRDLAGALLRRGHSPMVYSPRLGPLADEIRTSAIPVVDDLSSIAVRPDIIHGQSNVETVCALLAFRDAPAVFFMHTSLWMGDAPPNIPRILR